MCYCGDLNNYFAHALNRQSLQGMTWAQVQNITSFYAAGLVNVDIANIDQVLSVYQPCLTGLSNIAWTGYQA
jgi:hypothetical protein